jgi:hypothetical protein
MARNSFARGSESTKIPQFGKKYLGLAERRQSGDISRKTPFFSFSPKAEKAIRIRSDDFPALYKILVSARRQGNSSFMGIGPIGPSLEPWEQAFEEELYNRLAWRLAKRSAAHV